MGRDRKTDIPENSVHSLAKHLGLSIEEFADKIGVNKGTVSRVISRKTTLTDNFAKKVHDAFQVPAKYIRNPDLWGEFLALAKDKATPPIASKGGTLKEAPQAFTPAPPPQPAIEDVKIYRAPSPTAVESTLAAPAELIPAATLLKGIVGVQVYGRDLFPRIQDGDVVYVDMSKQAKNEDLAVLLYKKDGHIFAKPVIYDWRSVTTVYYYIFDEKGKKVGLTLDIDDFVDVHPIKFIGM